MNLLITPAFQPTLRQTEILEKNHTLYYLADERIPLREQILQFDPAEIEGIICNFFFLHNTLEDLPNLRYIQAISAGLDRLPVDDIRRKNIALYNAAATYATPMAEWAVSKVLEIYKHSHYFFRNQQRRLWEKRRDIRELAGTKATIIGFGNVGRRIAQRLRAFEVSICAVDLVEDDSGLSNFWFPVSEMKRAVQDADILILTLPLTDSTYHIIDNNVLSAMKDDAVLINVARGKLIDEEALIAHLHTGRFLGVALDVFEQEPLSSHSPLWDFDRVISTPHNSFVGNGNNERLFRLICQNLM